jgi:predicted metal-binding membrane protein
VLTAHGGALPTAAVARRTTAVLVGILLALAGAAWWVVVRRIEGMDGMASGLAQLGTSMPMDVTVPVFLGMWVTMMAAMMLPTVLPMVLAHRLAVRQRGAGWPATAAFVGGYLGSWAAAGIVPAALFPLLERAEVLSGRQLAVASGIVLAAAGLYQFTGWKRTCLRACRSPVEFLLTHDFGAGARGAVRAGVSHGLFCLGCCWALMSVLVAVGLMNLVWMVGLSLVLLAEKTWRRGDALARPVGVLLTGTGLAVAARPELLQHVAGVAGHGGAM